MKVVPKKIWNDPVYSKIIAQIIIASGGSLLALILSLIVQLINKQSLWQSLHGAFVYKIQIWLMLPLLILVNSISYLIAFIKKKKVSSFRYDERTLNEDKELLKKIKSFFDGQNNIIYSLKNRTNGMSVESQTVNTLIRFEEETQNSNLMFNHPCLRSLLDDFVHEVKDYNSLILYCTIPTADGMAIVPQNWVTEQSNKFMQIINDMHLKKYNVYVKYEKMTEKAKQLLHNTYL